MRSSPDLLDLRPAARRDRKEMAAAKAVATARELHDLRSGADHNHGAALSKVTQQFHETPAGVRIENVIGVIEQDDLRLLGELANDGDALLQPRGQQVARADPGVEPLGKAFDGVVEAEQVREIQRLVDAFAFTEIGEILEHGAAIERAMAR